MFLLQLPSDPSTPLVGQRRCCMSITGILAVRIACTNSVKGLSDMHANIIRFPLDLPVKVASGTCANPISLRGRRDRQSMAKTWQRQASHGVHLQNSVRRKAPEVWDGLPLRWLAASASHQRWIGTAARAPQPRLISCHFGLSNPSDALRQSSMGYRDRNRGREILLGYRTGLRV